MNKKILSILVMIMALSLFTVSCSYAGTSPSGNGTGETTPGGGGTTPGGGENTGGGGGTGSNLTVVTSETIASAIKSVLGTQIPIGTKQDGSSATLYMPTDNSRCLLSDSAIKINIIDTTGENPSGCSKKTTIDYFNSRANEIKSTLSQQGIVIEGNLVFQDNVNNMPGTILVIDATATSIKASTDTESFTLPDELKNKNKIKITFELHISMGEWGE